MSRYFLVNNLVKYANTNVLLLIKNNRLCVDTSNHAGCFILLSLRRSVITYTALADMEFSGGLVHLLSIKKKAHLGHCACSPTNRAAILAIYGGGTLTVN